MWWNQILNSDLWSYFSLIRLNYANESKKIFSSSFPILFICSSLASCVSASMQQNWSQHCVLGWKYFSNASRQNYDVIPPCYNSKWVIESFAIKMSVEQTIQNDNISVKFFFVPSNTLFCRGRNSKLVTHVCMRWWAESIIRNSWKLFCCLVYPIWGQQTLKNHNYVWAPHYWDGKKIEEKVHSTFKESSCFKFAIIFVNRDELSNHRMYIVRKQNKA